MLRESEKEPVTLTQRSVREFGLLPSSGFRWAIAADWADEQSEYENDCVTTSAMRAGLLTTAELLALNGDGNGYGDGDGYGDGNGGGNGYGGSGYGGGYGDGDGNGGGNGYGGGGYGDGYGDGDGNGD